MVKILLSIAGLLGSLTPWSQPNRPLRGKVSQGKKCHHSGFTELTPRGSTSFLALIGAASLGYRMDG